MKTISTFTDAGWDITGTIWKIDDTEAINSGYPFLAWQDNNGESLPVELTSFTAISTDEKNVVLNWKTATEVNNYGFEVERQYQVLSSEEQHTSWITIAFVEGHGNSNSPKKYEYIDNLGLDLNLDLSFEHRLKQIDTDGNYEYFNQTAKVDITVTDVNNSKSIPAEFALEQNYPNPFNPTTTIKYSIPNVGDANFVSSTNVTLIVFDILGRQVATLVNKQQAPGNYSVNFDVGKLASGRYIYKLQTDKFLQTKKMLLLR